MSGSIELETVLTFGLIVLGLSIGVLTFVSDRHWIIYGLLDLGVIMTTVMILCLMGVNSLGVFNIT